MFLLRHNRNYARSWEAMGIYSSLEEVEKAKADFFAAHRNYADSWEEFQRYFDVSEIRLNTDISNP